MSVSYFVFYRGHAEDPERFVDHYRNVHVPILSTWPGIQSVSIHLPIQWDDSQPVRNPGLALAAQVTFADREALQLALASEPRQAARRDFGQFPRFVGDVFHQAMKSEQLK